MGIMGRVIRVAIALAMTLSLLGCTNGPAENGTIKLSTANTLKARAASSTFDDALYTKANIAIGGRLYDTWWSASDLSPAPTKPTSTHPIWLQTGNVVTGEATWRCKSCHGYDYAGAQGFYGRPENTFFTGITGIVTGPTTGLPTLQDKVAIFDFIKIGTTAANLPHDFGAVLSDADIYNLTLFVVTMQQEMTTGKAPNNLIDFNGLTVGGMEDMGKTLYIRPKTEGGCGEAACHQADGRGRDFVDGDLTTLPNSYVDTEAQNDPWKVLHKVRFGNSGTPMLGLQDVPTSNPDPQQAALDVLAFVQNGLIPSVSGFDYRKYQDPSSRGSYIAWDIGKGGRLYDSWWKASDQLPTLVSPGVDAIHPLWPSTNPTKGATTFQCVSCHGWDYAGVEGALANTDLTKNPLFTGVKGFISTAGHVAPRVSPAEVYDFLSSGQVTNANDHRFGDVLSENDLYALTRFVLTTKREAGLKSAPGDLMDITTGIAKKADQVNGWRLFNSYQEGQSGCDRCHGNDGRTRPLSGKPGTFLREISQSKSLESLHKIRFGLSDLLSKPNELKMYGLVEYSKLDPQAAIDLITFVQNGVDRNSAHGGRLYDNWMLEANSAAPTTSNPLLLVPNAPALVGNESWRCASCHGFNFLGTPNGGNNLRELKRVREWDAGYVFDFLKNGRMTVLPLGNSHQQALVHEFGPFINDADLWSLASFAMNGVENLDEYVSSSLSRAIGNSSSGAFIYKGGNGAVTLAGKASSCIACHGADGKMLPPGSKLAAMDIYHLAWDAPYQFFHRVRFGMPGTYGPAANRMPGVWELTYMQKRLRNHDAADVMTYAQNQMKMLP